MWKNKKFLLSLSHWSYLKCWKPWIYTWFFLHMCWPSKNFCQTNFLPGNIVPRFPHFFQLWLGKTSKWPKTVSERIPKIVCIFSHAVCAPTRKLLINSEDQSWNAAFCENLTWFVDLCVSCVTNRHPNTQTQLNFIIE